MKIVEKRIDQKESFVPHTGSAACMESLEKVWNLFFQFPDLETFKKKGLELFAFYLRKF